MFIHSRKICKTVLQPNVHKLINANVCKLCSSIHFMHGRLIYYEKSLLYIYIYMCVCVCVCVYYSSLNIFYIIHFCSKGMNPFLSQLKLVISRICWHFRPSWGKRSQGRKIQNSPATQYELAWFVAPHIIWTLDKVYIMQSTEK